MLDRAPATDIVLPVPRGHAAQLTHQPRRRLDRLGRIVRVRRVLRLRRTITLAATAVTMAPGGTFGATRARIVVKR